jgi:hypothetical protein
MGSFNRKVTVFVRILEIDGSMTIPETAGGNEMSDRERILSPSIN